MRRYAAALMVAGVGGLSLAATAHAAASLPTQAPDHVTITTFRTDAVGYVGSKITSGANGNLWFILPDNGTIGRMTPRGRVRYFRVPGGENLSDIIAGPDRAVWFSEIDGHIGRITSAGAVRMFSTAVTPASRVARLAVGPSATVWFTDVGANLVGRMTTDGWVTTIRLRPGSAPRGIARGIGNTMWVASNGFNQARRKQLPAIIRLKAGSRTRYLSRGLPTNGSISEITRGNGGFMWFAAGNLLGRISPSGRVRVFRRGIPKEA